MSRPRRKMFGPLFYTTVVVAVVLTALVEFYTGIPTINDWLTERSLIRSLQADDFVERELAMATLVKLGSGSAVPHLVQAAHDPRGDLRGLACRYLIEAGSAQDVVLPILVAAASDVDEKVRYEAALAFGRLMSPMRMQPSPTPLWETAPAMRTETTKALRRLLHDEASLTRIAAADALGFLGPDPETAADLVTATGDEDREVRFAAARALLKVNGANDRAAARTLVALLADPEPIADRRAVLDVVKSAAADVQDQAVAALTKRLADVDLPVHGDVVDCLVAFGPRARVALPALERLLDDKDPANRASAGLAAATIEGRTSMRAIAILLKMIDDVALAPKSRQSALEKIRELNEAELVKATPILIRQLGSQTAQERFTAMEMLGSIIGNTPAEMPASTAAK